jgi:hypothetical protein
VVLVLVVVDFSWVIWVQDVEGLHELGSAAMDLVLQCWPPRAPASAGINLEQ